MNTMLAQRIKDEVTNDPDSKGYAGKDSQSIADLLNKSTEIDTPIYQPEPVVEKPLPNPGDLIGTKIVIKDAPVLRLIVGIPGVANSITAADVTEALK